MKDKYAYKPEAETAETTAVTKKRTRGRKPKSADVGAAAAAPDVVKAAAAAPEADEANGAAPETAEAAVAAVAEADDAACTAAVASAEAEAKDAEVAEAEAVLKDAEARFAAAPDEDTRGGLQIAKSFVARMKRQQIAADRVQTRSAPTEGSASSSSVPV